MAARSSQFANSALRTPLRPALVLASMLLASVLVFITSSNAGAQTLRPKRSLTVSVAPGCESAAPRVASGTRDNAEARRLAAAGQEAALVGDQTAARDAFAKAAVLNPTGLTGGYFGFSLP